MKLSSQLDLKDVLFVPQFKFNLLSLSAATLDLKIHFHFFLYHSVIQDASRKKMIVKGKRVDLYILESICVFSLTDYKVTQASVNVVSIQT